MVESILSQLGTGSNQMLELVLLILAAMRIYLEIIGFDFNKLPLTKAIASSKEAGRSDLNRFHRMGLYFSIGYILMFAPGFLMA